MSGGILTVSHLTVGYGERPAAADVSFSLRRGEILCLVGESGCGKSTLLKALLAAPEVRLFSGSINLEGTELSALPEKDRRKVCCERMGIVFQTPEAAFNPIRSYRRQFAETLKSHGRYDAAAFDKLAEEAFLKVELTDWRRVLAECPYALSGGMNQRAALALALLLGQEILLCDEPTSALDATIQLQVAKELKRLRDRNRVTQILVTHNLALAGFLADRIGVMYAGRLVELGRASDVLQHPVHPYTRSLIAAVPGLDGRMPIGLPGSPPMYGPSERGCEFRDRCPLAGADCARRAYVPERVGEGHAASCSRGAAGAAPESPEAGGGESTE